jgi:hypothetical protein
MHKNKEVRSGSYSAVEERKEEEKIWERNEMREEEIY